jgi:Domain of unknown function (DUF4258)
MMVSRGIDESWVQQTVLHPETTKQDVRDASLVLAFRKIPAFDNRWLRVVYRKTEIGLLIITVFFDRNQESRT